MKLLNSPCLHSAICVYVFSVFWIRIFHIGSFMKLWSQLLWMYFSFAYSSKKSTGIFLCLKMLNPDFLFLSFFSQSLPNYLFGFYFSNITRRMCLHLKKRTFQAQKSEVSALLLSAAYRKLDWGILFFL